MTSLILSRYGKMPSNFTIPKAGFSGFVGYQWNSRTVDKLAEPSVNCLVTDDRKVTKRLGFQPAYFLVDGVTQSSAIPLHLKTYDVTFFTMDTKVYYRDETAGATYDTGISLTAGTTTRITEWFGIIFFTNTTDGVKIAICGRLNDAAANSGDGTVTIDISEAGRLAAFSLSADNLRINGTVEDMASIDVATGIVTLNVNLTQSYANGTFCIVTKDITSEKFSKIEFWKDRLHGMGFPGASATDQPNNTVMAGQFVAGQTAATGIELIVDFTYGTGGSTKILVGGSSNSGGITNILSVKDFLYFFTETKTFAAANSDVTTSGAAIGETRPTEKDELHGCGGEDLATVMGDNAITYVDTDNKRIMRIPIDTDTGAALSHPEEDFDLPIRGGTIGLSNMNSDQTGALVYHYRGGRQTIYQLNISGQWYWFIFDQNIRVQASGISGGIIHGAWQPPQNISPVRGLFERNGVLYGTDASNDNVYSFFTTFTDNLAPISTIIASGQFEVNAMMGKATVQGDISQAAEINVKCYVWNESSGKRSGSAKVILGSDYSYSADSSVSAVAAGDAGGSGESIETARWKKSFGIFPSQANLCQLQVTEETDGAYCSLSSFSLSGRSLPGTFTPSL